MSGICLCPCLALAPSSPGDWGSITGAGGSGPTSRPSDDPRGDPRGDPRAGGNGPTSRPDEPTVRDTHAVPSRTQSYIYLDNATGQHTVCNCTGRTYPMSALSNHMFYMTIVGHIAGDAGTLAPQAGPKNWQWHGQWRIRRVWHRLKQHRVPLECLGRTQCGANNHVLVCDQRDHLWRRKGEGGRAQEGPGALGARRQN
jgi:hypothetical protein